MSELLEMRELGIEVTAALFTGAALARLILICWTVQVCARSSLMQSLLKSEACENRTKLPLFWQKQCLFLHCIFKETHKSTELSKLKQRTKTKHWAHPEKTTLIPKKKKKKHPQGCISQSRIRKIIIIIHQYAWLNRTPKANIHILCYRCKSGARGYTALSAA